MFGIISVILHHHLETIRQIYDTLRQNGVTNPERYLGFYSLRAYDKIDPQSVKKGLGVLKDEEESGEKPQTAETTTDSPTYVTELLYIHSKLMIVDDRIVICGSGK